MAAMDKQALKLRNMRAGQSELAQRRALEYAAQKPQLLIYDNEPKPIEGMGAHEGGEKGIARLIGRRKAPKMKGAGLMDDLGMVGDLMSQSFKRMFGGAKEDDEMSCECEMKTEHKGRKMPKVKGSGGGVQQIVHASMSSGKVGLPGAARTGAQVPPGGVAPVAYGNPPQAPKGYIRNSVMLDRAARGEVVGSGAVGGGAVGGAAPSTASKRAERGRKIAMIMREKGMTLGQASAWLKAHGSE